MFPLENSLFHPLEVKKELPKKFTFPFYYEPHELCIKASEEVQQYLETQQDFNHNFGLNSGKSGMPIGKMFGVMIVQKSNDEIGYLTAFSGKLANSNFLKGFVPPIFDTLNEQGFYKIGENELNRINQKIEDLEHSDELKNAHNSYQNELNSIEKKEKEFKAKLKEQKANRKVQRVLAKENLTELEFQKFDEELSKQSIYFHFRLRDFKKEKNQKLEWVKTELENKTAELNQLKQERKTKSADLQKQLHQQYKFLNFNGKSKELLSIFAETNLQKPPAGSGECAAPKLFQYAYLNNLKPIAMAEFWWGKSPSAEVRKHKQFYPSCRGKCEPILGFMMQGLDVEENPMENQSFKNKRLEILYEDDFLLAVNKPHEFLSVPGRNIKDSVLTRMKSYLPNATGPLLVHRLDMSTSGILLVAKNERTHKKLQKQFIERSIKKRYVALLDGLISKKSEIIDLPLIGDFNNRPQQKVCFEHGKPAKTKYELIDIKDNKTKVYFYPITGRTHQLRVHSAHSKGLNTPIVGDDIYGKKADRLYLHAERLTFTHPVKNEEMEIVCECLF